MMRAIRFTLLFAVILTCACTGRRGVQAAGQSTTRKIAVTTATARLRTVPAAFEETGSFVADESSDIAPPVAGRVVATPVNVGDFVKEGQVVCELDHRDAQLKLDQARAQLDQAEFAYRQAQSRLGLNGENKFEPDQVPEVVAARANYESALASAKLAAADAKRYENLVNSGDVSRSAYEKARTQQETAEAQANAARQQYEAQLNSARWNYRGVEMSQATVGAFRSQLEQAKKGVEDTTVRAPFDGFITARPVAAGQYVATTNKVATIVRINSLKLQLQTPEQRAATARVGLAVEARVSAYPDRVFTGRITAINPSVDPNSRVFVIEARFDNPKAELRPGMFAIGKVLLSGGESAVFVPRAAVTHDKTTDSYQVFTVNNGVARLRVVVTGDTEGDSIRISSGLAGTETVATSNLSELFDGVPVEPRS
jgi:multidrug efflux pump subunit AcrA (membrane-fusion protein)